MRSKSRQRQSMVGLLVAALTLVAALPAGAQDISLEFEDFSSLHGVSDDGAWVFVSTDDGLVASDTDDITDVYVYDVKGRAFQIVPIEGGDEAFAGASGNGRHVVIRTSSFGASPERFEVYDPTTSTVTEVKDEFEPSVYLTSLMNVTDDGRFLLLDGLRGLGFYDPGDRSFETVDIAADWVVESVAASRDGRYVGVTARNGQNQPVAARVDQSTGTVVLLPAADYVTENVNTVTNIAVSPDGAEIAVDLDLDTTLVSFVYNVEESDGFILDAQFVGFPADDRFLMTAEFFFVFGRDGQGSANIDSVLGLPDFTAYYPAPTTDRNVWIERSAVDHTVIERHRFDVVPLDAGFVFSDDIFWAAREGVTKSCNPPLNTQFCPDEPVTRGQMAAFLNRAIDLPPRPGNLPVSADYFLDDNGTVFEDDINALAESLVTQGCNPPANDQFCPDDLVTRGQMAAFLVRALGLPEVDPGDMFTDDDTSVFESDIDAVAAAGIADGCDANAGLYCPDDYVTRGQMTAFLHRALGAMR